MKNQILTLGLLLIALATSAQEMTEQQAREIRLAEEKRRQQKLMDELLSSAADELKINDRSYYTEFEKGYNYHIQGDHANAKPYYESCLSLNPRFELANYNLADIYSVRGETEKALAYLKKSFECGFTDVPAMMADDEMSNLMATQAFKDFISSAYKPENQRADELAAQALASFQGGDYQSAIDTWQTAISTDKSSSNPRPAFEAVVLGNVGFAYQQMGYNQKAMDYLKKSYSYYKSVKNDMQVATMANNIAYGYFGMLKTADAIPYLEEALRIHRDLGIFNEYANDIMNIGGTYYQMKDYKKAFLYTDKALEYAQMTGDQDLIETVKANRASSMIELGMFEEGISALEKSVAYYERNGKYLDAAIYKGNLGMAYMSRKDYNKAKQYFEEAIKFHRQANNKQEIATLLGYLGDTYEVRGDFNLALKYAKESYDVYKELDNPQYMVFALQSVASIHRSMGRFSDARATYQEAYSLALNNGLKDDAAISLLGVGMAMRQMGQLDGALTEMQKAEKMMAGYEERISTIYINLGLLYSDMNRDDMARSYYEKALAIDKKLGDEHGVMVAMTNIAAIDQKTGSLESAIASFEKSLAYYESRGELDRQLTLLANIGAMYYQNRQATSAVQYFERAINIGERLRLEAEGGARRDYLATIVDNYRWLMYCHAYQNDAAKVFEVSEAVHGRVLGEQLGANVRYNPPSLYEAQSSLGANQALLVYTDPTRDMIQMAVTSSAATVHEEKSDPFANSLSSIIQKVNSSDLIPKRGFKIKKTTITSESSTPSVNTGFKEDFEKIVMYYRALLKDPVDNPDREMIARKLYSYLFSGVQSSLSDKKELLIIPDGILAYLPFETLITPDGQYLAEKFDISYVPSFSIYKSLKNRIYSSDRKELIAYGGAIYESARAGQDDNRGSKMISSSEELQQISYELLNDDRGFKKVGMVAEAYPKLGVGSWADLPGTLTEVQNIKSIFPGSVVKTGSQVAESSVKGESLSDYRIVHFATHGIVVPEIPQLSALVLNQSGNTSEDGYLTMVEIQNLKLKADFVNMSACETGLGRIYGGEGVVGLTSSFLLAGANGVSASLWQVADESTMEFMTGVYQNMKDGKSAMQSSSIMKRKFISGEIKPEYRHPFYWAPFVYYGK